MRLAQAETGRIDAAILDVNLAGRPSFPVADLLTGHGVPVIFATGYGDLPDGGGRRFERAAAQAAQARRTRSASSRMLPAAPLSGGGTPARGSG